MSEWQEVNLGELATIKGGKRLPKGSQLSEEPTLHPYIRTTDISNHKIKVEELLFVPNDVFPSIKNYIVEAGDLIISIVGTIGSCAIIPSALDKASLTENCAKIVNVDESKLNKQFLYYYLVSEDGQAEIESRNVGSTQPKLPLYNIAGIPLVLPPLVEQKAIASVLSSLDDKIDLLHRQNTTLERMAETLFRQWFVEEAQGDWPRKPLGEFVTIKRGGSPRPIQEFLSESGYRWLKISDVTSLNSPFIFDIKEHIKVEGLRKTVLLNAGSLVLSNSATPGIPKILTIDSCVHDGWLHFPKSYFSNEFLYLLFNHIRPELISHGNGSIFTNLKTDILKEFVIPIPNESDLKVFQNQIKSIFDKLLSNAKQIQTLEKLRDNLLPKLMSGEVRVEA